MDIDKVSYNDVIVYATFIPYIIRNGNNIIDLINTEELQILDLITLNLLKKILCRFCRS